MGRATGEVRRQPTLTEELDQAEKEARVTKALQAVDQHGMVHKHGPKGQTTPHEPQEKGVSDTPIKTPKRGATPSPVKIDDNGEAWELEDHEGAQEEQGEEAEESSGGEPTRRESDPRARAGSLVTEGPGGN